jgi:hypothetical protein
MKKSMRITLAFAATFLIVALIINPLSARSSINSDNPGKPIPESIMKIAEKSCVKCHADPARGMAKSMLNLSTWEKLSPEKQASKAKAICNKVTNDKMPPKKFRKGNPDGIPSKDEIATICDWSQSLQTVKK